MYSKTKNRKLILRISVFAGFVSIYHLANMFHEFQRGQFEGYGIASGVLGAASLAVSSYIWQLGWERSVEESGPPNVGSGSR